MAIELGGSPEAMQRFLANVRCVEERDL
jgi:hypothetical protein